MQEIKKRTILLASVLKPADEPRMFERLGMTLANEGYEVFIIGFPAETPPPSSIHFIAHKKFNRISWQRVFIGIKTLKKILFVKPQLLIITTHELIGVALLYKLLTGNKIVYDVQENYSRNIKSTNAFPKGVRSLLSFAIRLKERLAIRFFSLCLAAEKCYLDEMSFLKGRAVVVENKCKVPEQFIRSPLPHQIQLLFTGTLAESTGVFEAIALARELHRADANISLKIVGQCALPQDLERMEKEINQCSFISLIGGKAFVPHQKIFEEIAMSHFGIISYPLSPHLENKMPTKMYEYQACGLPILLQNHKPWTDACLADSFIPVDFNHPDCAGILKKIKQANATPPASKNADWSSEEPILLAAISAVFK